MKLFCIINTYQVLIVLYFLFNLIGTVAWWCRDEYEHVDMEYTE